MRSVSIAWVLAAGPAAPELLVAAAGPLDDVDGDPGPSEFIAAASQKFTKKFPNLPLNLKSPFRIFIRYIKRKAKNIER